jgi:4-hydroxy-2-oxoheptanedioate aldolase
MGQAKCIEYLSIALLMAGFAGQSQALAAQEAKHLNPVIEKLAAGKAFIGFQTSDLSPGNARAMARAEADYVYVDMEHTPLDFTALNHFAMGMVDKAGALRKGNPQPNMALFARFPPYGKEGALWIAKQALDAGLMGVIFNGIDTPEQATLAVQSMRYPQKRTSKYQTPPGVRGYGPAAAAWVWGISTAEYERRADVWPLNPDGDLFAIMMIESAEGIKNAGAIAAVPGVGGFFIGAGSDLRQALGVEENAPEVEEGRQTILRACLARNIACGLTETSAPGIARRLTEGWKMIRTTEGAFAQWRASPAGR